MPAPFVVVVVVFQYPWYHESIGQKLSGGQKNIKKNEKMSNNSNNDDNNNNLKRNLKNPIIDCLFPFDFDRGSPFDFPIRRRRGLWPPSKSNGNS